jgi:hypothetical protein
MFGYSEFAAIRKEAEVITAAPVSFFLVLLVVGGVMWTCFHAAYQGKIDDLNIDVTHWHNMSDYYKEVSSRPVEQLALPAKPVEVTPSAKPDEQKPTSTKKPDSHISAVKPQQPTESSKVTANNGGIAIGRDNNGNATVNNIGAIPRELTSLQQSTIASQIGLQPTGFTGITCLLGDQEGCGFATQLMNALRLAGWKIEGLNQAVYSNPLEGTFVAVAPEDSASPPDGVMRIYNTLRSAGIPIQGMRAKDTPTGKFGLLVGAHTHPD